MEKSDIGNTVYVFRSKIDKSLVDKVCKEYNVENKSESFGNCTIYGVDNGSRMKIYNDGSFEMYTDSFSLDEMTISTNDCIVKARDGLLDGINYEKNNKNDVGVKRYFDPGIIIIRIRHILV